MTLDCVLETVQCKGFLLADRKSKKVNTPEKALIFRTPRCAFWEPDTQFFFKGLPHVIIILFGVTDSTVGVIRVYGEAGRNNDWRVGRGWVLCQFGKAEHNWVLRSNMWVDRNENACMSRKKLGGFPIGWARICSHCIYHEVWKLRSEFRKKNWWITNWGHR